MSQNSSVPIRGAIAAMTRENVIGLDGKIPWHYSADLKRFKQTTLNSTIIMGRLTWESIGSRALPGRRNIVISRNPAKNPDQYNHQDIAHFRHIEQAIAASAGEDIWVIGGGQIYNAVFSWLTRLDITYVPDIIDSPDAVKFPAIDPNQWEITHTKPLQAAGLVNVVYQRI